MLREDNSSHPRYAKPVSVKSYAAILKIPWAEVSLGIHVQAGRLISVDFLLNNLSSFTSGNEVVREAVRQFQMYFRNPRHRFTLPLSLSGTTFQRRVWKSLRLIPAGETLSYGELARKVNSSARAIGGACRANPIPIIIPCHRIVAAHGMGGFMGVTSGKGLQLKQRLLIHESSLQ